METISLERHIPFPHLEKVLEEIGEQAEETYRTYLEEGQKNTMREALSDSVKFEVVKGEQQYEVGLNLAYYWKFVEGGTKGEKYPNAECRQHIPPHMPIYEWIKVKPVLPQQGDGKRLPTQMQLSYAIAKSIGKNGIKPFPALQLTTEEIADLWKDRIQEAFMQDIGEDMENTLRMYIPIH